jgi:hypothetical protein
MRSIDLSHPLNRLARMRAPISVRTPLSWHSSRLQAFSPMALAATVDQQNSAIAEGVGRASGEARVGADAMSRVAGVTTDARSTASGVKDLAGSVAVEAEGLEAQVRQFLNNVQAA